MSRTLLGKELEERRNENTYLTSIYEDHDAYEKH